MTSPRESDGPAVSQNIALATWGLFAGLALLMFAGGLFATLIGVRAERSGVATAISSSIAAAYYVGFLVGSWLTLKALGKVGHIRVYAALASMLAAAIAAVGITDSSVAWILLRLVTGVCTAGVYVVAESWLNDLATNENRGRLLAVYSVLTMLFYGLGQFALTVFDARLLVGFAVAAIVTSMAVAPVSLSETAVAPAVEDRVDVSLRELARIVPTGIVSCLLIGIAHGAIAGMSAVYATRVGMSAAMIGLFVALPSLGGVVLSWPVSAASDDIDRRAVGVAAAGGATLVSLLLLLGPPTHPIGLALIALLGGLSYPLYSIAAAYTNDWVEPEHVNAAASQLVRLYGIGAVIGPFVAAGAMIAFEPVGFLWSLAAMHAVIAIFFLYRMFAWRSPLAKRPWDEVSLPARAFFVPATIISFGRRAGRRIADR
ncbi:MAG: MFS transporter [Ilumatobacteraceae bacterium]